MADLRHKGGVVHRLDFAHGGGCWEKIFVRRGRGDHAEGADGGEVEEKMGTCALLMGSMCRS